MTAMVISESEYRTALGHFASGVVIVTGSMPPSLYDAYSSLLRYQARLHCWFSMITSEYAWGMLGDFVPPPPASTPPPLGAISGSTAGTPAAAPPPPATPPLSALKLPDPSPASRHA